MKCWLLNYPRPVGLEPTIYLRKPVIDTRLIEIDDGQFIKDSWTPEILEYTSVKTAYSKLLWFNKSEEYVIKITIEF